MTLARLHVRLRPGAEKKIRSGHPWVFAESIREQNRPGTTGELAVVFDKNNTFLALGLYDESSPIRIRIIHSGKSAPINAEWWVERFRKAVANRSSILTGQTNAARLINGESDGFPALVLDRYDQSYVLKLYSAIWFERLDEIRAIVQEELKPERIILRLSRNIQEAAGQRNLKDGLVIDGAELEGAVQFLENGIKFEADILKGQKTGFFLDQRENRREIGLMAKGKTVLNAFSFSGGFSVYAAAGGARSVTDLDISAHALESSRRNFALNDSKSLRECKHEIIQADAFEWLKTAKRSEYDLIVLDPPALAKRQNERERALAAYSQLALSATKLARKKGRLLCCSCSAHVRSEEFIGTVENAMKRSGRKFEVTKITREPLDHHPSFPEAEYLKAIYLALD